MTTKIETSYINGDDITVIWHITYDTNGNEWRRELTGFYYGDPDDDFTKMFDGDRVATYGT